MTNSIYGLPTAEPEEVGLSSERLSRLRSTMQGRIDSGECPGIVTMIARHGKVAYFEAQGMKNIEAGEPIVKDSMFRIASLGKMFAAIGVMILYEDGLLTLNDPISKYLPNFRNPVVVINDGSFGVGKPYTIPPLPYDFGMRPIVNSELCIPTMISTEPAKREITVRDCLTWTTGIAELQNSPISLLGPIVARGKGIAQYTPFREDGTIETFFKEQPRTEMERVELMAMTPLVFHPGTQRDAEGPPTALQGVLAEVITGKSLEEFFRERMYGPLGMNDTAFYPPEERILSRLVTFYSQRGGKLVPIELPSETQQVKGPKIACSGGGGQLSTIPDLARFAQMLLNGGELNGVRILSRKTIELMTVNHIGDLKTFQGEGYGFGLGVTVRTSLVGNPDVGSVGSYSWGGGFTSTLFIDPKEDMFGIGACQVNGGPFDFWADFQRLAYMSLM